MQSFGWVMNYRVPLFDIRPLGFLFEMRQLYCYLIQFVSVFQSALAGA